VAAAEGAGFDAKLLGSGGEARLLLAVGGMVCAQCSAAVEACLRGRPGVSRACASLISNQAEARPMGANQARRRGRPALARGSLRGRPARQRALGWRGRGRRARVHRAAATPASRSTCECAVCGACAHSTAAARSSAPKQTHKQGCASARASDRRRGAAQVVFDPALAGARDLVEAVRGLGFEVALVPADDLTSGMAGRARERRFWLRKFLAALVFSARGPAARCRRSRRPARGTILWRRMALRLRRRAQVGCCPMGAAGRLTRAAVRPQAPIFLLAMVFGYIPALEPALGADVGCFTVNEIVQWVLCTPVQARRPRARAVLALRACEGPWMCAAVSCCSMAHRLRAHSSWRAPRTRKVLDANPAA